MRSPHDKNIQSTVKKQALILAILLSLLAFLGQIVGAWYTGSIALLGDTAHVFTDLFSLLMSLVAVVMAANPTTEVRSFGLYRLEVLAAFLNGLLLLVVSLGLVYESVNRFFHPHEILPLPLIAVALFGLIMNLLSAYSLSRAMKLKTEGSAAQFQLVKENPLHISEHCDHSHPHDHHHHGHSHSHSHSDRNLNSALMHVISDAVGSVAVIVGAIFIYFLGWNWVDPVLGLILALVILRWGGTLVLDSAHVLLEGTPTHIHPEKIIRELKECDSRIVKIEDLHVWEITSSMYAATAEVEVNESSLEQSEFLRKKLHGILAGKYGIAHIVLAIRPHH